MIKTAYESSGCSDWGNSNPGSMGGALVFPQAFSEIAMKQILIHNIGIMKNMVAMMTAGFVFQHLNA